MKRLKEIEEVGTGWLLPLPILAMLAFPYGAMLAARAAWRSMNR